MRNVFGDSSRASAFRAVIRAAIVCLSAFGLSLDPTQMASVQVLAEALLQFGRTWYRR